MQIEQEVERIVNFIKDTVQQSKTNGIVIGVSGGIDSAVTAALCVSAIGKSKVFALILPIQSRAADVTDAKLVANQLGIKYQIIDLTDTFDIFVKTLAKNQELKELTKANLKPRMRMCAFYFYANHFNYLVAGTSNKSEDEIGYFTKYGDGAADFFPIAHLYKREVRELARFLKLPEKIITRKPSAGLWEGQTTEDEVSQQLSFSITYEALDEMLENISKNTYDPTNEKYRKLNSLREKNRHKIQAAPALKRITG